MNTIRPCAGGLDQRIPLDGTTSRKVLEM